MEGHHKGADKRSRGERWREIGHHKGRQGAGERDGGPS